MILGMILFAALMLVCLALKNLGELAGLGFDRQNLWEILWENRWFRIPIVSARFMGSEKSQQSRYSGFI
jgi:hypothetical protein